MGVRIPASGARHDHSGGSGRRRVRTGVPGFVLVFRSIPGHDRSRRSRCFGSGSGEHFATGTRGGLPSSGTGSGNGIADQAPDGRRGFCDAGAQASRDDPSRRGAGSFRSSRPDLCGLHSTRTFARAGAGCDGCSSAYTGYGCRDDHPTVRSGAGAGEGPRRFEASFDADGFAVIR